MDEGGYSHSACSAGWHVYPVHEVRRQCPLPAPPSAVQECGGSGICPHDRQRAQCVQYGGSDTCQQGRQRWKECCGSSLGLNQRSTTRVATRIGLAQLQTQSDIDDASDNSHWACSALGSIGYRRREWQLALGLLSCGPNRIATTLVATRIGLAQLWTQSDIDDASGSSHWACSAADPIGYRRRE